MKRNIELSIQMELGRLENLIAASEDIKKKAAKLKLELERYASAIEESEKRIERIGIREFHGTNDHPVELPGEAQKRQDYNRTLQSEKVEYIRSKSSESLASHFERKSETGSSLLDLAKNI